MREIKLWQIDDPINYLLSLLKRQMSVLDCIRKHPKRTIASMYVEHERRIEAVWRDVVVACNTLKQTVFGLGDDGEPSRQQQTKAVRAMKLATQVAQNCFDLLDELCISYRLPETEYILFSKIGALLE